MVYNNNSDLPNKIRNHLSPHAQDIYREAFNNAYELYKSRKKRRSKYDEREVVAHKVAWSAVKKKYTKKADGNWYKKFF